MIGRRNLIAFLGGVAAWRPVRGLAQAASDFPLVAVLWPGLREAEIEAGFDAGLRGGLKEGGFVEGTNMAFAMRYANGDSEQLGPLAAEIAALRPRVIVAMPAVAVIAAHRAAPTVPLVFTAFAPDPVALGLVASFARPGGMVTGNTVNAGGGEVALVGKRIGLLKELVPNLAHLGLIDNVDSPDSVLAQNGAKEAGSRLGFDVLPLPVRTLDDVEAAFASGLRAGVDAFYVTGGGLLVTSRVKIAEFATRAGKPTIGQTTPQGRSGLLMSYARDAVDGFRHAGIYTAKILAGAKPGDLPIEQADKFIFTINLKTAKTLGIAIPPRLLLLADETIE